MREGGPGRVAEQALLEAGQDLSLKGRLGRRGWQGRLQAAEEVGKQFVVGVAVADRQWLEKKKLNWEIRVFDVRICTTLCWFIEANLAINI